MIHACMSVIIHVDVDYAEEYYFFRVSHSSALIVVQQHNCLLRGSFSTTHMFIVMFRHIGVHDSSQYDKHFGSADRCTHFFHSALTCHNPPGSIFQGLARLYILILM
jgi:hypothetical protein